MSGPASGRFRANDMANLIPIPNSEKVIVVVADSTPMDTQLLVAALAQEKQFQVLESPPSSSAILGLIRREMPHVIVLSEELAGSPGGADLICNIRAQAPAVRVIVLLKSSQRESVIKAFREGAQGVFCRTEPLRLLAKCIRCVYAGQVWASSSELHYVLQALGGPARARFTPETEALLSAREIDVVVGLTEGLSNREIAKRLNLTEHTVKNYLCRIFEKLGVSSRVEVILHALGRNGSSDNGSAFASLKRPHLISENGRSFPKLRPRTGNMAN